MDPALYDNDKYRAQLLRQMRAAEAIVYSAVFAPPDVSSEPVLVAATSTGMIHVFMLQPMLEPAYWEQVTQQRKSAHPGPTLSFQAHPTQIYTLAFAGDATTPLLVSGGDQDFRVWRWHDIAAAAVASPSSSCKRIEPVHVAHLPREPTGVRGALSPLSEVNAIAIATQTTGQAFLAGGDARAYEWDLGTQAFVRTFAGHSDYLHTLQHLPQSHELVTGAEDGSIGLWDARQATALDWLRPQPLGASTNNPKPKLWVGAVAIDATESWLASGGGQHRAPGHAAAGGFVSLWHLPSRVPLFYTPTTADVHDVVFHHMDVRSVGADARVCTWNRSAGTLRTQAHSTIPSHLFCAVDKATDIIAVGGHAPVIDVYAMPGVVSFSLVLTERTE